ncbi:MAG: type IX secretion system membrane protein PorP/SprF [Flavobacteriales bacterium]|nr:type IX secretion system membrane protein PorP/SprF [Flavobacteriales bacterium]
MKKNTPQTPVKLSNLELFIPPSKIASRSRILSYLLLLIATLASEANGQDPQFTQFFTNPLYLNPAFAGTYKCPRLAMNYRNEWPALSGTFVTTSVAFDKHIRDLEGGIGILIMSDRAGGGTLNTVSGNLLYSYFKELNRFWALKAGFQVGYIQKKVDWEKLTFGDMIDPRYGFIYETAETASSDTKGNLDISSGILVFSKKLFGGFAVHHLTRPNEGFIDQDKAQLPMKFTVHAGSVILIDGYGEDFKISPNIIYQQQQDFRQLNFGCYLKRGPLYGGLWYRQAEGTSDSFILLTGLQMGVVQMGYSYDVTLSRLSNASGGSHELSMVLLFDCRPTSPKYRPEVCPVW